MSERTEGGGHAFPMPAHETCEPEAWGMSLRTHAALEFAVVLIDRTPTDIRGALDNAFLAADLFVAKAREGM